MAIWKGKSPLLVKLDMELTERCNNRCVHCYINRPENDARARSGELSTREIQRVLDEAAGLGCLSVRFTGGEPLLRDDFSKIYIHARKLGMRVMLFTNATRITPEIAELFSCIPPLDKIEITLYGMRKETYERVSRAPGSFTAAWNGIHRLWDKNIPFIVKGVLLPANREDASRFESWAATIPWMERAPSYTTIFDLRCRRDSEKKNTGISGLRSGVACSVRRMVRQPGFVEEMKSFCAGRMEPAGNRLLNCGAGKGKCAVDAYGMVQPCLMLRHPATLTHIKNGGLRNALVDFFPKIRQMKAEHPDYLNRCAVCFIKSLCEQCPAKSWMEHGETDKPVDYLCEITHGVAKHLGLLRPGEKSWRVTNWKARIDDFILRIENTNMDCKREDINERCMGET